MMMLQTAIETAGSADDAAADSSVGLGAFDIDHRVFIFRQNAGGEVFFHFGIDRFRSLLNVG